MQRYPLGHAKPHPPPCNYAQWALSSSTTLPNGDCPIMDGRELRQRLITMGWTHQLAAEKLGLSQDGLRKQLYGARRVSTQTKLLVELREQIEKPELARQRAHQASMKGLAQLLQPHGKPMGEPDGHTALSSEQLKTAPNGQDREPPSVAPLPPTGSSPQRVLTLRTTPATAAARRYRQRGL